MSFRRARVTRDIRGRIAEVIATEVRDPRLALVTITDAEVSPDLSFARIFYRPGGEPEQVARALLKAKPFIRRRLAEKTRLRRVPELDFRIDWGIDRGARVEKILAELRDERREPAQDDGGQGD